MNLIIEDFRPEWAHYFVKFNQAWIEKYFTVEPIDTYTFENLEEVILKPGGNILFALLENEVIGAVSLKYVDDETLELSKMAIDEAYLGVGAGKFLCNGALEKAKSRGFKKVLLYTHSSLQPAISIYKKLGFSEVLIESGKYKRADVKMEVVF